MLRYYITDRTQFNGDEDSRRLALLQKIAEAASAAVDFIQLREKDLSSRDLGALAREAIRAIRGQPHTRTQLLINSRTDIAIAVGADGVHLRSEDISPQDVRHIWPAGTAKPLISVSCHTIREVNLAAENGANFALFGPVFGKQFSSAKPVGMHLLNEACHEKIPVIALGGVTRENAESCLDAGAAGIAGIRLFQ